MNLSTNWGGGCHSSHGRGKIWICNLYTYLLFASVYLGVASADSEAIASDDLAILAYDNGCKEPTEIGELKMPFEFMKCLDVARYDGKGKVEHYDCDGYKDQKFKLCEDGTLRSMESDYCIDREGSTGLTMKPCSIKEKKSQQWSTVPYIYHRYYSDGGIANPVYYIKNEESGMCISYVPSTNAAELKYCQGATKYIFHNRGKVLGHGRLRLKGSGLWLIQGTDRKDLFLFPSLSQDPDFKSPTFTFYENGDLMNDETGLCVKFRNTDINNLETRPCNSDSHVKFEYNDRDDFVSFDYGNKGCMSAYIEFPYFFRKDQAYPSLTGRACEYESTQLWEWVPAHFYKPKGQWRKIDCYVTEFTTDFSISDLTGYGAEVGAEISTEISAGFEVNGIGASSTVSTSVYASMSAAWETEKSSSISIKRTCPGPKACLWQWDMTMKSVDKPHLDPVEWQSSSFYCSTDDYSPVCPAHSKCQDADCKYCVRGLEDPGRNFKDIHDKLGISSDEL